MLLFCLTGTCEVLSMQINSCIVPCSTCCSHASGSFKSIPLRIFFCCACTTSAYCVSHGWEQVWGIDHSASTLYSACWFTPAGPPNFGNPPHVCVCVCVNFLPWMVTAIDVYALLQAMALAMINIVANFDLYNLFHTLVPRGIVAALAVAFL